MPIFWLFCAVQGLDLPFFMLLNTFPYEENTNVFRDPSLLPLSVADTYALVLSLLKYNFNQIGPEQIEALYQYAKFQFECGNYSGAADYLYQYRGLCTNNERSLSALWGKLAAEILMQNWDVALEELNRLKEIIDSKVSILQELT